MKAQTAIVLWLRRRLRGMAWLLSLGLFVVVPLSAVAGFLTFWFIYILCLFGLDKLVPLTHEVRMLTSAGILLLWYIIGLVTDYAAMEAALMRSAEEDRDPRAKSLFLPVSRTLAALPHLSALRLWTPASGPTFIKGIVLMFVIGPRLLTACIQMVRQVWWFRGVDLEGCAAVLAFLSRHDERVPYQLITEAIPEQHNPVRIYRELRAVDGILVLRSEPAGLSLTEELRTELRQVRIKARENKGKEAARR